MKARLLITAGVAALAVSGGIAYATIPGSHGVISACVAKAGDLRVVDAEAGAQCKSGETTLSWSQQGPKGEQGQTGERGPSNGFFVRRDGQVVSVPYNDFGAVDGINLPAGNFVLFGTARFAQAPFLPATTVECVMLDPQNGFYVTRALAHLEPGHNQDELTLAGVLILEQPTTADVLCKAGAAGVLHDQLKLEAIQVSTLTGGGKVPVDP